MVSPPCLCLGAALRAALGCFPSRSRPAPKRGAARPAPVLLRAVLPPCKASQETAGGLSGVKASALCCALAGGAWARAGVAPRRWTRPHRGLPALGGPLLGHGAAVRVGGPASLWTSVAGTARAARARSRLAGLAWSGAPFGG